MDSEKFEAIGQRGEACHILLHRALRLSGELAVTYSLATGERLRPTEVADHFETMDGKRVFRLRAATKSA